MRKVNLKDIEERAGNRRKEVFGRRVKEISIALGRDPNRSICGSDHPFDLALVRISKGKRLVRIIRTRANRSFI